MSPARPDSIEFLTGKLSTRPYPSGISLPGHGGKFTTGGDVQIWQGNTFICHVARPSSSFSTIVELQEQVKRSKFSGLFSFLPAPSFHMTLFQGLSPGTQGSDNWPAGLSVDADRDEATAEMLKRVADLTLTEQFNICATDLFCATSLTVVGVDNAAESALRKAREMLKAATLISPSDFHGYVFHISLGYLIQWLSESTAKDLVEFSDLVYSEYESQLQEIELDCCEFCNFDNMHAFLPVRTFG